MIHMGTIDFMSISTIKMVGVVPFFIPEGLIRGEVVGYKPLIFIKHYQNSICGSFGVGVALF